MEKFLCLILKHVIWLADLTIWFVIMLTKYLFTTFLLYYVHHICSLNVHYLLTRCLLYAYFTFIIILTKYLSTTFSPCNIHSVLTEMFTICSLDVHCILSICSVHSVTSLQSWMAKKSCHGQTLTNECFIFDYLSNFEGL